MQLLQGWDTGLKLSPRHPASKWSRSQTLRRLRTSNSDVHFRVFIGLNPKCNYCFGVTNSGVNGLNPKNTRPSDEVVVRGDWLENVLLMVGSIQLFALQHVERHSVGVVHGRQDR